MKGDMDMDRIQQVSEELLDREYQQNEALRLLLDWKQGAEDHHVAAAARMGTSQSYLASVSLGWIAANVYFAHDLPIFKEHQRGDSRHIDINDVTATYLQQRQPDFRRQQPMAMYLATRRHHKFPPLLLVAYQDWVYDPGHDRWDPHGRAMEHSLRVRGLDTDAHLVDLDVATTTYFALDGQHRLMAIKGLKELLDNGRLGSKKQDGVAVRGRDVTREEVEYYLEERGLDPHKLQGAMNETVGVEIIPAVQNGETFKQAVARLRNVFVDVNENARRLGKGELALLDENDGFRIVARTIMTKHSLFKGHGGELNVDTKKSQLSEQSRDYTLLNTLVSIAHSYLRGRAGFERWGNTVLGLTGARSVGPLRPHDDEIGKGLSELSDYFDALSGLPSHESMILHFSSGGKEGKSPAELRTAPESNILFRPIAQVALAHALAKLWSEKGVELNDAVECLARHERTGDLNLARKSAPWFGVLCDPADEKMRRKKEFEYLCAELMTYLLGGGFGQDEARREKLLDRFFEARRILTDSEEEVALDMKGRPRTKQEFSLPDPWQ